MSEYQNGLPTGWDRKYDEKSGKHYYVNHYSKTTTWDDPRFIKHGTPKYTNNITVDYIPLQHRSPEIRRNSVYPNHSPPIEAFGSHSIRLQDKKSPRSPLRLRSAKVQDAASGGNLENSVAKISAMFPTVSETHIKLLLNKYLNREALVISALQVEKHPITTPGPFATPPPQRNIEIKANDPISRSGSPHCGFRPSPKSTSNLHSSPKLKLRYMKSLFPHADETIILECLQNNENSIQKTSENLNEMGYRKRESVKVATPNSKTTKDLSENVDATVEKSKTPSPLPLKIRTNEEKTKIKEMLREKYEDVAEHLITIALESVNFDEQRANQILKIMKQEDEDQKSSCQQSKIDGKPESIDETEGITPGSSIKSHIPITQSRQSIKSLLKAEKKDNGNTNRFSRVIDTDSLHFKSANLSNTQGHNDAITRGPNQKLLLENYVQWQGSNRSLTKGPQNLARGPNKSFLSRKIYTPCGPNAELRKGPGFGFAKESIFNQMKAILVGESRLN
ncbi:hypothetical protein ABEB36_000562 [Hypothenemus hampei]|uniref:Uncharacterized protein n=1 Tax=Hypothenemus hampei TaxID=57062 RepID=A0ABD1FBP5_HYPHA